MSREDKNEKKKEKQQRKAITDRKLHIDTKADEEEDTEEEIRKEIEVDEDGLDKEILDIEGEDEDENDGSNKNLDITDITKDSNEGDVEDTTIGNQSERAMKNGEIDEEWRSYQYLYDFDYLETLLTVKEKRNKKCSSIIRNMAKSVLCIPASEAVCERFFRNMSLRVKKQYVTNLKCKKACMITYLLSNCTLVYDIHKTKGTGEYF